MMGEVERGAAAPREGAAAAAGRPATGEGGYTKEPSAEDEGLEIFQAALSAFWRFWQLATAVAALAVMCAAGQNGLAFQSFQAFIWLVAAMSAVIAWALFNLARDVSALLPKALRRWLFLLTEFNVAWIALSGASAAAGLTTFGDRGPGAVQPGYCEMGSFFHSLCARTKASTAMAFLTFFVFIPTIISITTKVIFEMRKH